MLVRTIAFDGAAVLLAGCAGMELGSTTGLTPSGTDFTKALYAGYVDLSKAAAPAAKAQTSFDCWMQEQEEDTQPKDIAACRDAFYAAMAQVEAALRPADAAAPAPAAPKPANFKAYFAFNSDKLNAAALSTLDAAAAQAKGMAMVRVAVSGYTDTAGASAYNKRLANKRAEAGAAALKQRGIKADDIVVNAFGEANAAVETKDNVCEAWNRRVEIDIAQ